MRHAPGVRGDPFRGPTAWSDAPDVQFVRERTLDEIDECGVRRPQRKVTVKPGGRSEDRPILRSPDAVRDEKWVSGSGRVVCESGAVARPVVLGNSFEIELRRSTQRRHRPDADVTGVRAALLASPKRDERPIWCEPQAADRWIDEFRRAPTGQVVELSRTDLRQPDVHRSVPIRQKRHKLTIA